MNDKKEQPSLEDLGLAEPVTVSNKISIGQLQRQSEYERDTPARAVALTKRSVGLDVWAGILAFILPGLGHVIKGRGLIAAAWFFSFLGSAVASFVFPPILLLTIMLIIANIVSAVIVDPQI